MKCIQNGKQEGQEKMKAILIPEFGGPEVLQIKEVETPAISENQVLIRVAATSVNYADILTRRGLYHAAGKPPIIPGMDAAGIIDRVGSGVKKFKVGQRVIALPKNGSYAEFIAVDENLAFALPDNVDMIEAAACPLVAFTAYKLLADVGRLQPAESVLIHAASGGVGTAAIQIAKILGAGLVIGTVGREAKIPAALEAGADHVLLIGEDFSMEVNRLTAGRGVDLILDSIAGAITKKCLACLATYGRLVIFGSASGEVGQVATNELHASCRAVLGFSLGTTRNHRPELLQETAEKVLSYLSDGSLKMKVDNTFSLEDAGAAHALMESRQHTGKIVLLVVA